MKEATNIAQAIKNLLIAQRFYPEKYEQFKKDLAVSGVPFVFTNDRFLEQLEKFSKEFTFFLKENALPQKQAEFEQIAPGVLVDSLAKELPVVVDKIEGSRRQRIEGLTKKFAKEIQLVMRVKNQEELTKRLLRKVSGIKSKNPRELGEQFELAFAQVVATASQSEELGNQAKQIAKEVIKNSHRELEIITSSIPPQETMTLAMVESPATDKAGWLEIYEQLSAVDPSPNFVVVDRLALVNEALHAVPPKESVPYNIFSRVDAGALQQPVRSVLDGVLNFYPKNVRDDITSSILRGGWEHAMEKAQERVGRFIVESPLYGQAVTRGNQLFGKEGRAKNFIWDLASSVVGSPVSVDVAVLEILGIAPQSYSVAQVGAASRNGHAGFHLFFDQVAGWGLQRGAGAIVRGAGAKIGGSAMGKFLGGLAGAIGGPLSSLLGALGGGLLASLFGPRGPRKPVPFWASTEGIVLLAFLGIIIGIPLLMFTKTTSEYGTFQGGGGGPGRGPSIDCTAAENKDSEICQFEACTGDNCAWPATGEIIQGPFAQCDGTTHSVVDAIDILGNYLDPVYSATVGVIKNIVSGCPDNPIRGGCNSNYGNYVEVQTPDGHLLRYAHLSELFINEVHEGQEVKQGDILGKMDSSGTESNHLHLEVRGQTGGQSIIAKYLPVDESFAKELYQCINSSGCRYCPQM